LFVFSDNSSNNNTSIVRKSSTVTTTWNELSIPSDTCRITSNIDCSLSLSLSLSLSRQMEYLSDDQNTLEWLDDWMSTLLSWVSKSVEDSAPAEHFWKEGADNLPHYPSLRNLPVGTRELVRGKRRSTQLYTRLLYNRSGSRSFCRIYHRHSRNARY
jgi:hypothetical protein